ncbi:MAG TPA: hypothetical protein VG013_17485, partial [Gemmataceae bacterium]|nr:hypothetical protein [Gemmataceae bacterium]
MPPALVVGIVAAAAAALFYYLSQRFDPGHRVLSSVCYTAVAALIPPVVYTVIEFEHLHRLWWWGTALAAVLALRFVVTRDRQVPWAISFGARGLRVWIFILLGSVAGYG